MKYALGQKSDGSSEIIDAAGNPLRSGDVTQKMLHVLPKLYFPPEYSRHISTKHVALSIIEESGLEMTPDGGIYIRQPYPNRQYYVAGSQDIRNGWMLPLPEHVAELRIELVWTLSNCIECLDVNRHVIKHAINVSLLPGAGKTYTFDPSCWPRAAESAEGSSWFPVIPVGVYGENNNMLENRDVINIECLVDEDENGYAFTVLSIDENIQIPPIKIDQLWSIDAFEEEQVHEIVHQRTFKTNLEQHVKNACVEMPVAVLVDAIKLAREISYEKDSIYSRGKAAAESHPAMKLLSDWWNSHCQQEKQLPAAFGMVWVRVRDDDEYWSGYYEAPNEYMESFESDANSQVRIGAHVLIQMFASINEASCDEKGVGIKLVNGKVGITVCVDESEIESGALDEAWYSLEALSRFPARFPVAWKELHKFLDDSREHLISC